MRSEAKQKWNATLYNEKYSFVYEYGASLIDLLDPQKGERILDIGCGSGELTQKIGKVGTLVTGIDSSEEMIKAAKSKFPALDFYVMDAGKLPFTESYDALFSNATLHWVLNAGGAVGSMFKALKKGGRLVAEFGGKGNVQTIVCALRNCLDKHGYHDQAKTELWYFPSVCEYASLLEQHGFRVTLVQHFDRPSELKDTEHGIEDWLEMFAQSFFSGIPVEKRTGIMKDVQQQVAPQLFQDGKWYADYKRIRIRALKE